MPFFHVKHDNPIPSDQGILQLARDYPELPSHFFSTILDRDHSTCVNRLAQLASQKRLNTHKPFIDPKRKISKHDSFSLREHGYRDTKDRPHRLGESLVKASTHVGVLQTLDFEYITWREMLQFSSMPRETLRIVDNGANPHVFEIGNHKLIPDGNPARIFHQPSNQHINIIDEYDRDTEPLTSTQERRTIKEKFDKYTEFFNRQLYKERYGFIGCYLRIVTNGYERMLSMKRLYEDHFTSGSPRRNVIFGYNDGDPFFGRSYPPADGRFFTMAYERVGYPPFKLPDYKYW
jgi:hypothetical protein